MIQETSSVDESQQKETTKSPINDLSKELERLKVEKQRMIEETKQIIADEKEGWKEEKQTYIDAAKEEGYKAGFETGQTESVESYQTLLEKANAIVRQTEADYHKEMANNEDTILQLGVHIAEKIIQGTLEKQPETFMGIVKKVLQELKETGRVTIYVHPDHYEYVFQQKEELISLLEEPKRISIYADDTLRTNSCIIEHPHGQIDANIDTQLEQVRKSLLELAAENMHED